MYHAVTNVETAWKIMWFAAWTEPKWLIFCKVTATLELVLEFQLNAKIKVIADKKMNVCLLAGQTKEMRTTKLRGDIELRSLYSMCFRRLSNQ